MNEQFKLEDKIMQSWQVVEDINLLLRMHCDKDVTDDQVQNFLLGLATIYQARFEELFSAFEDYLRSKRGTALAAALDAEIREREACARLCDEVAAQKVKANSNYTDGREFGSAVCAAAIRARGENKLKEFVE